MFACHVEVNTVSVIMGDESLYVCRQDVTVHHISCSIKPAQINCGSTVIGFTSTVEHPASFDQDSNVTVTGNA